MDNKQQVPQKSSNSYGKRPLWFWILVYVIVGAVVYGIIYLLVAQNNGGSLY